MFYGQTIPRVSPQVHRGQARDIDKGLVGHWTFDGGAQDVSGNGNNGTVYGAVRTRGVVRGAYKFDGVDDYIEVPHSPELAPTSAITCSAWVRDTGKTGDYENGLRKGSNASNDETDNGYAFLWEGPNYNNIFMYLHTGGAWHAIFIDSLRNNQGVWRLYTVTYDSATGDFISYVDGHLQRKAKISGAIDQNTDALEIGKELGTGDYFKGILSDVRVYNRALSPTEIRQLYLLGTNRVGLKNYLTRGLQQFYQTISVIETPVVGLTKQSSLKRLISVVENSIVNLSRVASLKRLISVSETAVVSLKRGFYKTISVVETAVVSLTAVKMFFKTISVIENSVVSLSRRANLSRLISVAETPIISLTKFKAVRRTIAVVENAVVSLSKVRRVYRTISVVETAVVSIAKKGWWRTIKHTATWSNPAKHIANWIFKDKH